MLFPIAYVKLLDIGVIALLLLCLYSGFRQGFLLKVLDCFGIVVSALLAWGFARLLSFIQIYPKAFVPFADLALGDALASLLNEISWFVVCFILLNIVIRLLHPLFSFVRHVPILAGVNRLLGVLFGFVQGTAFLVIFAVVFQTPFFANGSLVVERSYLRPFAAIADNLTTLQKEEIDALRSLQKIMTPSTQLKEADKEAIRAWLNEHDINEQDVMELFV